MTFNAINEDSSSWEIIAEISTGTALSFLKNETQLEAPFGVSKEKLNESILEEKWKNNHRIYMRCDAIANTSFQISMLKTQLAIYLCKKSKDKLIVERPFILIEGLVYFGEARLRGSDGFELLLAFPEGYFSCKEPPGQRKYSMLGYASGVMGQGLKFNPLLKLCEEWEFLADDQPIASMPDRPVILL
jgi:hypothetical protein